jgi:hypothetical protein
MCVRKIFLAARSLLKSIFPNGGGLFSARYLVFLAAGVYNSRGLGIVYSDGLYIFLIDL